MMMTDVDLDVDVVSDGRRESVEAEDQNVQRRCSSRRRARKVVGEARVRKCRSVTEGSLKLRVVTGARVEKG